MRLYEQACSLIGASVEASFTNGRTKFLRFEGGSDGDGRVAAVLMGTAVVTFRPDGVEVRTGGWVTASTFDAIATALEIGRGDTMCGTRRRVPYVLGHRMHEGMVLGYDGTLVEAGSSETPLAPPRR
jgi:hypothetical protein